MLDSDPQTRRRSKVLVDEIEPRPAGRLLQFRRVSVQNRRKVLLPARHGRPDGKVAADRRDGNLEFGE